MTISALLAPLLAQVALTFVLLTGMVLLRRQAVRNKKVKTKDLLVRGGNNPWPAQAAQFGDAYLNVFELPVLFYVLTILVVITQKGDFLFIGLAWLFVFLRIVQAGIHTTSNARKFRSLAFRGGAVVLGLMWIIFMVKILSA